MDQTKKYNRIKYVRAQQQVVEQQHGEGLITFLSQQVKELHHLQLQSFLKKSPKKLLQRALKSLLCLVRKLLAKVLQTKL